MLLIIDWLAGLIPQPTPQTMICHPNLGKTLTKKMQARVRPLCTFRIS